MNDAGKYEKKNFHPMMNNFWIYVKQKKNEGKKGRGLKQREGGREKEEFLNQWEIKKMIPWKLLKVSMLHEFLNPWKTKKERKRKRRVQRKGG